MRKLYLFVNSYKMSDWLDCLSLTDDGHILGNHICSSLNFIIHDLHNRKGRLQKIKSHFKNEPYEIIILDYDQCKNHTGFMNSIELAKKLTQEFEKAGAIVDFVEIEKEPE